MAMASLVCAYQSGGQLSVLPLVDAVDCPGVVVVTGGLYADLLAPTLALCALLFVGLFVQLLLRRSLFVLS